MRMEPRETQCLSCVSNASEGEDMRSICALFSLRALMEYLHWGALPGERSPGTATGSHGTHMKKMKPSTESTTKISNKNKEIHENRCRCRFYIRTSILCHYP